MIKKLKDERIIKETNEIRANLYFLMLILIGIVSATKYIFFTKEISNYILELAAIIVSICYIILMSLINRIPIFFSSDNCIKELQNKYRSHGFAICFFVFIVGEFILLMIPGESLKIIMLYPIIWFIPSIIVTVKAVKRGLILWGGKNRKKSTIKSFKKRVVVGSLFYGIFMRWSYLWNDGRFQPIEVLKVIGMAIMWGVPFYFIMKLLISAGERNSNKNIS